VVSNKARQVTGMQNGPMPIRRPLVLTGAPAIGKSATGLALALGRTRCAFVDVDDVRQLVVVGGAAPWQGAEGVRQQLLGVRNACALAHEFAEEGIETVLADVLTTATLSVYRKDLADCVVVRMFAPLSETLKRASTRPAWLTESEFRSLYEADATNPLSADHTLDVAQYDLERQVAEVERLWSRRIGETT